MTRLADTCSSIPSYSASSKPYDPNIYIKFVYTSTANNIICSIYSTFVCLILSVIYYMCRPSEQKLKDAIETVKRKSLIRSSTFDVYDHESEALANMNFRKWWKRGRYILVAIFTGTISAAFSLISAINVYYQIFFSATDTFCSYTRVRVSNYSFGYVCILILCVVMFYICV